MCGLKVEVRWRHLRVLGGLKGGLGLVGLEGLGREPGSFRWSTRARHEKAWRVLRMEWS